MSKTYGSAHRQVSRIQTGIFPRITNHNVDYELISAPDVLYIILEKYYISLNRPYHKVYLVKM